IGSSYRTKDIVQALVLRYDFMVNSIILALSPANQDIATSDAIRLAKEDVRWSEIVQPAVGGRDLLRMFKELRQSVKNDWGRAKSLVFEEDKEFLDKRKKLQDFETELTNVSQQSIAFDQFVVNAGAYAFGVAT
ncbi:sorting nexin 2B, partial [Tanacetum coccineum]